MKTSHCYYQFLISYNLYKIAYNLLDYDYDNNNNNNNNNKYCKNNKIIIDKNNNLKLNMKTKYHLIINIILKYIIKYLIKFHRNIIIINNEIYDLTNFKYQHPGGYNIIHEYNGLDATYIFKNSLHSSIAIKYSKNFLLFSNLNYFYQSYYYNKKYSNIIEKLYISIIKRIIEIDFNDY